MKKTRAVTAGGVQIGGGAPITVQSMTNTRTEDAEATAAQILALEAAGCDIVRVSVYSGDAALALREIKRQIHIPLVADIHFDYRMAIAAAENGADKIRINPGNIGGEQKVRELVACLRDRAVPIRVGVNSGSVEKELLNKYGGVTPEGLAESALSHVAILERAGFYDTVVSVKASDVFSTVKACRLVNASCSYPQHIGVTEAGGGEMAIIKAAAGLGALLSDGIGDTLRVSITGDPVEEVRAGRLILSALRIRREGVEIVSCPTCGRTRSNLVEVAERVKSELSVTDTDKYLRVAVMGCAVNGPGEAREADIGIALGENNGVVFRGGEQILSAPLDEAVEKLIFFAKELLSL